jgi:MFS family permease
MLLSMVVFYFTTSVFIQSFLSKILNYPLNIVMFYNSLALVTMIFCAIISGLLSDIFGPRIIPLISGSAFFILSFPLIHLLNDDQNIYYPIIAQQIFSVITGFYSGSVMAIIVNLFPSNIRYTGVTFSMNITSSIFGGTVPLIALWLINNFNVGNGLHLFSFYIMACALCSVVAIIFTSKSFMSN